MRVAQRFVIVVLGVAYCVFGGFTRSGLWDDIGLQRLESWQATNSIEVDVAESLRERVRFAETLAAALQAREHRLNEDLVRHAESILAVYRELLEDLEEASWSGGGGGGGGGGKLASLLGNGFLEGLPEREAAWAEHIEAAEELVLSGFVKHSGAQTFLNHSQTFARVFSELEGLHGAAQVPHEAFGVSIKVHESGAAAPARYHFAVHHDSKREAPRTRKEIIAAAKRFARLLDAPDLVFRWIDTLKRTLGVLPVTGFGIDEDDGIGKVYVYTSAGRTLPPFPLSLGADHSSDPGLHGLLPWTAQANWSQMVSLEWEVGARHRQEGEGGGGEEGEGFSRQVRLRHYQTDGKGGLEEFVTEEAAGRLHPVMRGGEELGAAEARERILRLGRELRGFGESIRSVDLTRGVTAGATRVGVAKVSLVAKCEDAEVVGALERFLGGTVLEHQLPRLRAWVWESKAVSPNLVSNVVMGGGRGKSFLALYRHPFERYTVGVREVRERVLAKRGAARERAGVGGAGGRGRGTSVREGSVCGNATEELLRELGTCDGEAGRRGGGCAEGCRELIARALVACSSEGEPGAGPREGAALGGGLSLGEPRSAGLLGLVEAVEMWAPAGCSVKHRSEYSYIRHSDGEGSGTHIRESEQSDMRRAREGGDREGAGPGLDIVGGEWRVEAGQEVGVDVRRWGEARLLCGEEACYRECRAAILAQCRREAEEQGGGEGRRTGGREGGRVWGGRCGASCEEVEAAEVTRFECRAGLCPAGSRMAGGRVAAKMQCLAEQGRGGERAVMEGRYGEVITDGGMCVGMGGRLGKKNLSCEEVERGTREGAGSRRECGALARQQREQYGGACCEEEGEGGSEEGGERREEL